MPDEKLDIGSLPAVLQTIIPRIRKSETDLAPRRDDWLEYYELYRNWREDKAKPLRSNEGLPMAFEWVEIMSSRLFDRFCGRKPYIRTKGREPSDDLPARGIESFVNWQLDEAKYKRIVYNLLRQIFIYGTGIVKWWWRYETDTQNVLQPVYPEYPEMGSIPQPQQIVTYDNIDLELVDLFDFVIDAEEFCGIHEATWAAHRTRRSLDYLDKMAANNIYDPDVVAIIRRETAGDENSPAEGNIETEQHKVQRSTIEKHVADRGGLLRPINIWEYCEPDRIVTIANDKYVLRETKNPYGRLPYCVGKCIETPHEFWGIGVIESGAPNIRMMEDLLNNSLDNINFAVNKMLIVNEDKVTDSELISRPGGIIHVTGSTTDAVMPIEFPDLSAGVIALMNMINEFAKRATGAVDYQTGQAAHKTTATEATLMTQASDKRLETYVHVFGETFVADLLDAIHMMNKKFVTDEKYVRVTGLTTGNPYEMVQITPDMFGANIDYIWQAEDREMETLIGVQQMTQALTLAQSHPVLMTFLPIVFYKILEKMGLHENDELMQAVNVAKELSKLMTMQIAMGMAGGQQGTGSGVPNAKKLPQGSANTRQSMDKKTNPQHGSVANVKG